MNELLQKYISGEASEIERERVVDWLREDEAHLSEYKRQRKLYDIALWRQTDDTYTLPKPQSLLKRKLGVLYRVAAVAAIAIASIHFYNYYSVRGKSENLQTVIAPAGQHAELRLADGTHIWLNSGSRLTFPGQFPKDARRVKLDGEGYFKVSSQAERPFIVETSQCDIRVLGTEFNVLAYRKDTVWETALLNGAVEILHKKEQTPLMRLTPGSAAVLKGNRMVRETIRTTDYFRWREGLICFNDISLRDMIEKLKLYYDVDFIVNNRQVLDAHYTGKFRTNDGIDHVMRVLSLNSKFSYDKDEESNTITIY
ncbi:FecR domain-containing protein [uncultured Bacteroides sp.]|uniref:FecR domain-containing protein n=1 Tax=uncultured Bacteroides sp. TaxID=162156 RepID=UPI0025FEAF80|nr:FecR domain-containing protein [uncultured Bacteroides sp.]